MPLENAAVVDLVSVDASGDEVIVHIVATEPWGDQQFVQLQAKLKNMVAFAADGQLERTYPDMVGKRKAIEVRVDYPPNEAIEKLIDAARQHWCTPDGIRLSVIVKGSSNAV